ncbi:hypothetical protein JXA27_06740 [Aerococcaceae bacterium zg-B36]|uniref:ATP-dependent DNA ligase n=1 Tax=Aerococcaceae bacterium zg-252 TaxID=2796928 RepID=UPI001BD833E4|nr:hypothetical protein [Aerococcaceae bacterium zg-B36]
MVKEIYAILHRIKNTTKKTEKEAIIQEFQDHEVFKETLYFLLNDFVTTGLAMKKIKKTVCDTPTKNLNSLVEVYQYFTTNNTGSDIDIANVQGFINKTAENEDEQLFLEELFTKTFTCGITYKTVNKALGYDFIPSFEVQLAYPYKDHANKVKGTFYLTTKLDGHRLVAKVDEFGKSAFFTRTGKSVEGLNEIYNDIFEYANEKILPHQLYNKGFILDGEIIASDVTNKEDVYSETSKIVRKNGDKNGLVFRVFDIVPTNEFLSKNTTQLYSDRRQLLDATLQGYQFIELIDVLYSGEDTEMIPVVLKQQLEKGEEGIMVNLDTEYQCKRTSNLLKVKEFYTDDLVIKGTFEGEGKYKGVLGGIIVDYNGVEVSVGSGFTDKQRKEMWKERGNLIGKVVEIQYFEESKNQNNDDVSLRFPTFKQIREDKGVDDANIES